MGFALVQMSIGFYYMVFLFCAIYKIIDLSV